MICGVAFVSLPESAIIPIALYSNYCRERVARPASTHCLIAESTLPEGDMAPTMTSSVAAMAESTGDSSAELALAFSLPAVSAASLCAAPSDGALEAAR